MENIYQENGYADREEYLTSTADNYGVPSMVVTELASLLGPEEDFDALVSELDDMDAMGMFDQYQINLSDLDR
jgi:hypothetical protein